MTDIARPKLSIGFKVYQEARTAHLERLSTPGTSHRLLYRKQSYDFDLNIANNTNSKKVSYIGLISTILVEDVDCIEINEPLFLRALPLIVAAIIGGWIKFLVKGNRPKYVAYAIENADIAMKISSHTKMPSAIVKFLAKFVIKSVFRQYDRIAFGTLSSKHSYENLLGPLPKRVMTEVFPAIEPVCPICLLKKNSNQVIFLGAFDHRKGVEDVISAWATVAENCHGARLLIIGQGPLETRVLAWSAGKTGVTVSINPSRAFIHNALSESAVLVLPSHSSERWREQVGLPIVEGLSHGCQIVTSQDTGLADWLKDHGHIILPNHNTSESLALGILSALNNKTFSDQITQSLPATSGRFEAEAWLWTQ